MKNTTGVIGRIIFALAVGFFGFGHLGNASAMTGMVPSFLPAPIFWVYLTGVGLLAATVSFLINKWTFYAGVCLAIFLLSVILFVHIPHLSDPSQMQLTMAMIVKDAAMAGGGLFIGSKSKD